MTGLYGLSFLFTMKKILILCLTFILFLHFSLSSFAISRFDAYAYWASAQNQVSFIGNDISNMFNYSKSTGLNPPASIQSEFYKNGYYSNNIALFNQHSGGTASFDLNSLVPVYSWTYNGQNGTSPLDNGFELDANAVLTLTDSAARLGSNNGITNKTMACDTSDQIIVYDFRLKHSGLSDETNFDRLAISFTHNGERKSICFTFNRSTILLSNITSYMNATFLTNSGTSYDFSVFRDCRFIIEGDVCSLYIDGVLYGSIQADSDSSIGSDGVRIGTWKYANLDLYSYSFKTFANPTTTVIVNLGRSVVIPAGDDMEFYVHLRNGSVTNVMTQTTVDLDFSLISQMSLIFNEQLAMVPIEYANDWLYVKVPSSDVDRTFSYCSFTAQTPYVNTITGDQLRWDMEMGFSDLVFGDPNDIGLNPDIDPDEDQFRDDVIDGIGDINDSLDSIHDVLITPPDLDEFNSVMDSVNGIFDEFDRYVFDKYPNFPPIPESPAPDFVSRFWLIVDEVLYIGIPLQSRNLGWLTFNSDDNVFRLSHFIVWFTTIFLTRAFIYAISEATKAKNNPIQGDGDD